MILKLYKSNISIGLVLLPVLIIIISLPLLFAERHILNYDYKWQKDMFSLFYLSKGVLFTSSIFLIGINTFLVSKVFNSTIIFSKQSFVASIIYLIFLSSSASLIQPFYLIVNFLLIILLGLFIRFDQELETVHVIFKSSLLIGLLVCFSYQYIVLFLMLFIYMLVFRKFKLRDVLAVFIGVLLPIFYLLCLQYFLIDRIDVTLNITKSNFSFLLIDKIKLGIIILFIVVAIQRIKGFYLMNTSIAKKQLYIINSLFIITSLSGLLMFFLQNKLGSLFLVPCVMLCTVSILIPKKDTILSLLLTIVLIVNIVSLYLR